MQRKRITAGKRFSRREIEQVAIGDLSFCLERIDFNSVFTKSTIEAYKAKAIAAIEAEGIDAAPLLAESPHGSLLRDFVLNYKEFEPDSIIGIAARLLELALHLVAHQGMTGDADGSIKAGLAFGFGRLSVLFDVYSVEAEIQSKRRRGKPLNEPYDLGRDERLRALHSRLTAAGCSDATKQTAREFGLSERQVRKIIKAKK